MARIDSQVTRQSEPRQWFSGAPVDVRTQPDASENYWPDALSNIPSRYEVLSHIGTGGMGIVYKVRDLEAGEIVALKILKPAMASAPAMQENLRKEVCLARKVTHKNVCRIHEFNRSNGGACISMEFVEGESLLSKLRRVGALPPGEAVEIARQICAGLREAHVQGIVHRDLKPANIMVDRSGTVKIMDFGIARLTEDDGQMTGTIAGTPAYMAPEQLELKAMGPQTDIYSLGLLLYEMVTGAPAFGGETPIAIALKQIRELPRRPSEIVADLPAGTDAIILKCLRKDPSKRFQSVDELDAALESETAAGASVTWPAALEHGLAGLAEHRAVRAGIENLRAAVPVFKVLGVEIRRTILDANRIAIHGVEKASAFLRAQDWRAATRTRTGIVVTVLLGSVVVFGVAGGIRSQAREFAAAPFAAPTIQTLAPPQPKNGFSNGAAPTHAPGSVSTDHIDLREGLDDPSVPVSDVTKNKVKGQSGAHVSNSSPRSANSVQRKNRPSLTESLKPAAHASVGPAVPADRADGGLAAGGQPEPVAPAIPTVMPNATPKLVDPTQGQKPEQAAMYLEVGSFKDANWAENAVEKLSALGYHAISVHQTRLWMQSFHVQVGPFTDLKDVAEAQKSLTSRGYKTRLVK